MQLFFIIAVLSAAVSSATAFKSSGSSLIARHRDLSLVGRGISKPKTNSKRCRKVVKSSSIKSSSTSKKSTPTKKNDDGPKETPNKAINIGSSPQKGTIRVASGGCGDIGATTKISKTAGPNGKMGWVNCGLTGGGWKPPRIKITDLVIKDIDEAMNSGVFAPCKKYAYLFKKYGNQYGIPPMFVAAFAMQESTCNAYISNGGLMQITSDKCGGAPGGKCNDPDFNVRVGTKYFADVLKESGGSVLQAIGAYNGWQPGMTVGEVLGKKHCQQNLDYLQQFVNGWLQGIEGYSLGTYKNGGDCAS